MNGRKFSQILLLELFAVFQGLAFGIIPAMIELFTNPHFHGLSENDVRILFIPFILASILLAVVTGWASQRGQVHAAFVTGMGANFTALALISVTNFILPNASLSFYLFFFANIFLGAGVGMALTILSRWVYVLFPEKMFSATLILWSAACFGMFLSVPLIDYVLFLHTWWLAPFLVLGALFILLLIGELLIDYPLMPLEKKGKLKASILMFLLPAGLYGYLISYWHYDLIFLKNEFLFLGFWAVATLSRLLVGIAFPLLRPSFWYCVLPLIIIIAPLILPFSYLWVGFAAAVLFPINLAWAQNRMEGMESLAVGFGMAIYLLGIALGSTFKIGEIATMVVGILLFFFHLFTSIMLPVKNH
jgi:MFS family permease